MTDVGLYMHIPFCQSRCGYCDFYTNVSQAGETEAFVDALLKELPSAIEALPVSVRTIFVGGGTPTILPVELFSSLFETLGKIAERHQPIEFSVEANPASLNGVKARILRDNGVDRISMGAQSFHDDELKVLDRIHRVGDIAPSVEIIRPAGFDHLNLDLIFGIPGQTPASWSESLRRAVSLGVDHLSCYGLTYEPETPMDARRQAGEVVAVSEAAEREMYLHAIDYLASEGIEQYEISNFARPGARCEHNLRYWRNEPVVGVGPSAASYIGGVRWRNVPDTAEYIRRIQAGESTAVDEERLSPLERAGETAMLALRTAEGIECSRFEVATGFDAMPLFGEVVARHVEGGLIDADSERIALTREGMLVADSVLSDFLWLEDAAGRG